MKVSDLITKLQSLPSNADVLCYTEDENFQAKGHMFRILKIDDISLSEAGKEHIKNPRYMLKKTDEQ